MPADAGARKGYMNDKRFLASQAHRIDDPARCAWLPPPEVLRALAMRFGDLIADLGAGTGYFSLSLDQTAETECRVYAVAAQNEMLSLLRRKLSQSFLSNVELIHAEAESTTWPDGVCDLAFLTSVWHEFADRTIVLDEVRRILKPSGRIEILDWRPDVEPEAGPPLDHRLAEPDAADRLLSNGFHLVARVNAGRYSWLVQGEKLE